MMRTLDDAEPFEGERLRVAQEKRAVAETLAVLRKASAQWAPYRCPGTAECCQLGVTKREPWLWPTEWQVILNHLAQEHRAMPPPRADGGCPFLDGSGQRCTIYEARPFGCRTFFCHRIEGPARQPVAATNTLLERLMRINVSLDAQAEPRAMLQRCNASR